MNDVDLHARLSTGPVAHHFVVGIELDREESDLTRFANQLNQIPGTAILNPDPFEAFPGHQTQITQLPDTVTKTASVLLEDTLDFGPHSGSHRGGARRPFQAEFNEPITNQHFEHTDTIASPRASVGLQAHWSTGPLRCQCLRIVRTSYDPSAENLSLTAKTASLAPEKDRTFEFGAKSTALDGRLALQAGIFQTTMTNARVGDSDQSDGASATGGRGARFVVSRSMRLAI